LRENAAVGVMKEARSFLKKRTKKLLFMKGFFFQKKTVSLPGFLCFA